MTATMQRRRQVVSTPRRRRTTREIQTIRQREAPQAQAQAQPKPGAHLAASLKASLVGGVGVLMLMLISLIPFQILAFLVIPGFLVVWFSTGMLAGVFAGDSVTNTVDGGKVGWMAGFWTGIYGGLIGMVLAAAGLFMFSFGQNILAQVDPETLQTLGNIGVTAEMIAMVGRVVGALIVFGILGAFVSALFSALGGLVYPKLTAE